MLRPNYIRIRRVVARRRRTERAAALPVSAACGRRGGPGLRGWAGARRGQPAPCPELNYAVTRDSPASFTEACSRAGGRLRERAGGPGAPQLGPRRRERARGAVHACTHALSIAMLDPKQGRREFKGPPCSARQGARVHWERTGSAHTRGQVSVSVVGSESGGARKGESGWHAAGRSAVLRFAGGRRLSGERRPAAACGGVNAGGARGERGWGGGRCAVQGRARPAWVTSDKCQWGSRIAWHLRRSRMGNGRGAAPGAPRTEARGRDKGAAPALTAAANLRPPNTVTAPRRRPPAPRPRTRGAA